MPSIGNQWPSKKKKEFFFVIYNMFIKGGAVQFYTVIVNRYSLSMTARANCSKKILATIKNHLSPADFM